MKKKFNNEKPKNFKTAIIRLFKELKHYRLLLLISLFLAITSSLITIFTPNILSSLTDEISYGLKINKNNVEKLSKEINTNIHSNKTKLRFKEILAIKINQNIIDQIFNSNELNNQEKASFQNFMNNSNKMKELNNLSPNILRIILPNSIFNGKLITTDDKLILLKILNGYKEEVPKNISNIILPKIKFKGVNLSSKEQIELLNLLENYKNKNYQKIPKLDKKINNLFKTSINFNKVRKITILLASLYIIGSLFYYWESISMVIVSNKFAKRLRSKISLKINKIPLSYFDNHSIGDILSRITNDVVTVSHSLNKSLVDLASVITLFVGVTIMMFITNYIMALTAIIASCIGFSLMIVILNKSQKYFVIRQKELGNLNGHIEEVYSNLNIIKVYNGIEETNNKFTKLNKKLYNANRKSRFLSGIMSPIMRFVSNLGFVDVCIVGALLTAKEYISFGVIIAFTIYVRLFSSHLSEITESLSVMQSVVAASERVFEFLDEKELKDESKNKFFLSKEKVTGNIEFKNVSFTYERNNKPTIKNFSAKITPGEKIAIVGPTGAGKTTMVNLLMKFYEVTSGDIIIDGISIKDLTRENIHDLFTMVLQDTWLFNGTVKENIVYNQKNISKKKLAKICKSIGLDHYIKSLPNSYETIINNDDSISAGERQLLTIARGMIKQSPFLILDEATSNVDTRTEEIVQKAMDKLTEGKTSFIIAHRLSTIKNASLILVMKDGNIVEYGTHKDLLNKNGFYASLYNSQFENIK